MSTNEPAPDLPEDSIGGRVQRYEALKDRLSTTERELEEAKDEVARLNAVLAQTTDGGATVHWMLIRDRLQRERDEARAALSKQRHGSPEDYVEELERKLAAVERELEEARQELGFTQAQRDEARQALKKLNENYAASQRERDEARTDANKNAVVAETLQLERDDERGARAVAKGWAEQFQHERDEVRAERDKLDQWYTAETLELARVRDQLDQARALLREWHAPTIDSSAIRPTLQGRTSDFLSTQEDTKEAPRPRIPTGREPFASDRPTSQKGNTP